MHKKAIELIKTAITEAETYEKTGSMTSDKWMDFYHCVGGLAKAICAEKDYQIIEAMKKAEEEDKIKEMAMKSTLGYTRTRRPYMEEDEYTRMYIDNPRTFPNNMKMGYTYSDNNRFPMADGVTSENGRSYENVKRAMRHYTETRSPEAMQEMEAAISEFFDMMEMLALDVTRDLEPSKRQKYSMRVQQMGQKLSQK